MTTEMRNGRAFLKPLAVLGLLAAVLAVLVLSPSPAESAFPGANGKIVFISDRDGNPEVYVMDPDGTDQISLSNNLAEEEDPAWSPDGSQIVFGSNRDFSDNIYVMNADGSGQTQLTAQVTADHAAAWSPDGSLIAFSTSRDGNSEVYVMNPDGSAKTNLTNNGAEDLLPAWSPDGSQIAFTSDRDGDYEIYVMNANGSGQTRLINNGAADLWPDWSPDGTKIAFTSTRDDPDPLCFFPALCDFEIYVMNADGSGQTNLTNDAASDFKSAWSPDGSKIAFSRDHEIYVMNADGSGQTNLTNNPAADSTPAWQPLTPQGLGQNIENLPDETLSDEIETSLVTKAENAQKSSDKDNICASVNQLEAFINQINAQRGKKVSDEGADDLIAYAQGVIDALNDQLPEGEACD